MLTDREMIQVGNARLQLSEALRSIEALDLSSAPSIRIACTAERLQVMATGLADLLIGLAEAKRRAEAVAVQVRS
jgi:hypothetical protein